MAGGEPVPLIASSNARPALYRPGDRRDHGGVNGGLAAGNGELRASDAERDAVAGELRQHLADGRLTFEEFSERLDEVYAARTRGDLARARRELPDLSPVAVQPAFGEVRRRAAGAGRRAVRYATPSLVSVGIWAADGAHGGFWPGWVMLATAFLVLRRRGRRTRRQARIDCGLGMGPGMVRGGSWPPATGISGPPRGGSWPPPSGPAWWRPSGPSSPPPVGSSPPPPGRSGPPTA